MRALSAVACLALASCFAPSPGPATPPIASGASAPPADQAADLNTRGVGDAPPSVPSLKSAPVQPGRRMEVVDVFIDQKDPTSGRVLASYLMKPEEWTILKCVQTSPTTKHWQFQRVVTGESERFDKIDPLRNPRR